MRIIFCYKARTDCEGYSIRKQNWIRILDDFAEIGDLVKKNVQHDYLTNIKNKVMKAKEKHLSEMSQRFDYQNILTIMPKSVLLKDLTKVNHQFDFEHSDGDFFNHFSVTLASCQDRVLDLVSC